MYIYPMKQKSNKNIVKPFENPFAKMTDDEKRALILNNPNAKRMTRDEFIAHLKEIDKQRLNDSQKAKQ